MIAFPNCKINLGLNIIGKRGDGFHNVETVFYPLQFTDALEIVVNEINGNQLTVTGIPVIGDQNNLCIKAYDLLKKDFPKLPFINIHLHKAIPMGAGLGGGSADAAFMLQLLNKKFSIGLSAGRLKGYALQLGSDCPFFIDNKPSFATGRGEGLEPLQLDLHKHTMLLINPGIHIDTSWAYSKIRPLKPVKTIKDIIVQPLETWKQELINDFEGPVFERYPEVKNIKEKLYDSGAVYASLTGSGSTVYGIFKEDEPVSVSFPGNYFSRKITM